MNSNNVVTRETRLSIVEDSDFAGDLEDAKSISGNNLMNLRKSNVCPRQLEVQEANVSVPQFYRV